MKNAIRQVSSGKYWTWHRANRRPLEGFRVPLAFGEVVSTPTRTLHILDVISSAPLISQDTTTLLPSLFVKRKFDESKESSISWSFPNLSRHSFPSTMTRATVLFHSSYHGFKTMKTFNDTDHPEPSYRGCVHSRQDVLILVKACQLGLLAHPIKLSSTRWKRGVAKNGSVFILQKTKDQKSWRDDRKWHCILDKGRKLTIYEEHLAAITAETERLEPGGKNLSPLAYRDDLCRLPNALFRDPEACRNRPLLKLRTEVAIDLKRQFVVFWYMTGVEKASSMPMTPSEDPLLQHLISEKLFRQARVGGTNDKAQINRMILCCVLSKSHWFRSTARCHIPPSVLRAPPHACGTEHS